MRNFNFMINFTNSYQPDKNKYLKISDLENPSDVILFAFFKRSFLARITGKYSWRYAESRHDEKISDIYGRFILLREECPVGRKIKIIARDAEVVSLKIEIFLL